MKIVGKIKKALQVTLVTGFAFFTSACARTTIDGVEECDGYKSVEQIREDAKYLNSNLDVALCLSKYLNGDDNIIRLKHNGDEPIYVYIDDDFSKNCQNLIQNSLDYVENIFKDINDKYRFEVVDRETYKDKKKEDKTVIEYINKSLGSSIAAYASVKQNSIFDSKYPLYVNHAEIVYDEDKSSSSFKSSEDKLYTLTHELLHCFGLGDVYTETKYKTMDYINNKTLMRAVSGKKIRILTPYDIKELYAMYYEEHLQNGEIDYSKLDAIKNKIDEYEKEYYSFLGENLVNPYYKVDLNVDEILNSKINFEFKNFVNNNKYELSFKDGKYYINRYVDNKLMEEISGEYYFEENGQLLFLKDVKVQNMKNFGSKEEISGVFDMYFHRTKYDLNLSMISEFGGAPKISIQENINVNAKYSVQKDLSSLSLKTEQENNLNI